MATNKDNQENIYLDKAIRGEKAGLEYLIYKYQDLAYTIAIKVVFNNEDAEEVVQDAFLKAFASLVKFKKASKFSTWLYRIVYNTAITRINGKTNEMVSIDDDARTKQYPGEIDRTLDLLKEADRKKYVELALDSLPQHDRLIIALHYIGEKSISEVCEILDMKKSAVKMRLLRARKQLETELEQLLGNEIKDLL